MKQRNKEELLKMSPQQWQAVLRLAELKAKFQSSKKKDAA